MALTMADIMREIRLACEVRGIKAPDGAIAIREFNRAQERFATETNWIGEDSTTSLVAATWEYNMPTGLRPFGVRSAWYDKAGTMYEVQLVHSDDIYRLRDGANSTTLPTGRPERMAVDHGRSKLLFYPTPGTDNAGKKITVRGLKTPTALTGQTSTCELPDDWARRCIHWVVAAMLPAQSPDAALERGEFEGSVSRARGLGNMRDMPDSLLPGRARVTL